MKSIKYNLGDVVSIELDNGQQCLGLIARGRKGGILFIYFFYDLGAIETLSNWHERMTPQSSFHAEKVGDSYVRCGRWPIVAHLDSWSDSVWDVPKFYSPTMGPGPALVSYDQDRLSVMLAVEKTEASAEFQHPPDYLAGARAAEIGLTIILFGRDAVNEQREPTREQMMAAWEAERTKRRERDRARREAKKKPPLH